MLRFENPVIAAVRSGEELSDALLSPVDAVFLLKSEIGGLKGALTACERAGKQLFVHADMCDGLGKDTAQIDELIDDKVNSKFRHTSPFL